MNSRYKNLKRGLFFLLFLVVIYIIYILIFAYNFTGDVYRNSEKYIVNIQDQELIKKINSFKEENKDLQLITTNEEGNEIHFKDYTSRKYYHVFFYFSDLDLTIQCLLNSSDNKSSNLALYSISKGVNFGSWKDINTKDLNKKYNKEIKKKFESEILDKLGKWRKSYFWE